jgi:tRNA A-37 threonylcarbamoyl transferase component Bud32
VDPAPSNINPPGGMPPKLGNYPLERELGRGGMGVVYLGVDPRLGRQVAIKVLPEKFAEDPVRLQRFEREARSLAALNHRNVGIIYSIEETAGDAGGRRVMLVLEFIPGRTLTQMLERGPLSIEESMRLCVQMAEGLEAAHEKDVVHRDLKPDNVRVTPDGTAKILDFGLAGSGAGGAQAAAAANLSSATTALMGERANAALTMQGMVMGTPGYMAPEQARGAGADKRADIWALGCVLYECLTGHRAFWGDTVGDCIAAVLERDPDFSLLPARTPHRIRELLRKMFVKEPRRRLRDVGDARIELEDVLSTPQSGWYRAADGAGGGDGVRVVARLAMPVGVDPGLANSARSALAISPDGTMVVMVVGTPPQTQLVLRRLDNPEPRPVPGTAGADAPFFSPDGRWIGFFEGGKLRRVALAGGPAAAICSAPRPQGGCWDTAGAGDTILLVPDWQRGLARVAATGGTPEMIVQPDLAAGELAFMAPELLPGGKSVVLTVWTGAGYDQAVITAIDLRSKQRRPLIHGGNNPRFCPSGHLIFSRGAQLMAVAFDPDKLEIYGQPVAVEDGVLGNGLGGSSQFAVGGEGTLVWAGGGVVEPRSELIVAPRGGSASALTPERRAYIGPRISPDGRRLAIEIQGATDHVYVLDLERPGTAATRLTFEGDNNCPVWSPDGKRIALRTNASGKYEIVWLPVEAAIATGVGAAPGSGAPGESRMIPAAGMAGAELLFSSDASPTPCCFTPDGKTLVFTQGKPSGGTDLWAVEVGNPGSARAIVQSPRSVWGAAVSPDARLIAYVSDESGKAEVYLQPWAAVAGGVASSGGAGGAARRQVSPEGVAPSGTGETAPVWAPAGGELLYRSGTQIVAVRVAIEPALMLGRPRVVFDGPAAGPTLLTPNYDLMPDGQRLVLIRAADDTTRTGSLHIALNWFDELRRRSPTPQKTQTVRTSQMGSGSGIRSVSSTAGTIV